MTIILSTLCESFAVLAADELIATHQGPLGQRTKLVPHPTLPLLFAVGGMMRFALNGQYDWAVEHVRRIADQFRSPQDLAVRAIAKRLEDTFQPVMNWERDTMQVFIALIRDGKAEVGAQWISDTRITDDPTEFHPGLERYLIPPSLADFYTKSRYLDALNDRTISDPHRAGTLAREAIQAGIDQERSVVRDGKYTIGGPIDVYAVTESRPPFWVEGERSH